MSRCVLMAWHSEVPHLEVPLLQLLRRTTSGSHAERKGVSRPRPRQHLQWRRIGGETSLHLLSLACRPGFATVAWDARSKPAASSGAGLSKLVGTRPASSTISLWLTEASLGTFQSSLSDSRLASVFESRGGRSVRESFVCDLVCVNDNARSGESRRPPGER